MQAIGWRHCRRHTAQGGGLLHCERRWPEQTTLYRLVQQHAQTFSPQTEAATGASLPQFIKDEVDAFLECGIPAHGFLRLRCAGCGHDKRVAFSCKHRRFCPSCRARCMSQTAARLVDRVIPHLPVRSIHLQCLALEGIYRRPDNELVFVEVPAPSDEALLHKIIARMMKMLTRRGVLVEEQRSSYLADGDAASADASALRPKRASA